MNKPKLSLPIFLLGILLFFGNVPNLWTNCSPKDYARLDSLGEQYDNSRIWKKDLRAAKKMLDSLEMEAKKVGCVEQVALIGIRRANALSYNNEVFELYTELIRLEDYWQKNSEESTNSSISFFLHYTWGRYRSLLGDFKAAESRFKKALSILNDLQQKNNLELEIYRATNLRQIGLSLSNMGRIKESIVYQELALDLEQNPVRRALNLKHIGKAYQKINDLKRAENYFTEALLLLKDWFGKHPDQKTAEHNNMIALLNDFARLNMDKAKRDNDDSFYTEAEEYIRTSLTFHDFPDDTELQFTYYLYGDLQFKRKQWAAARDYYQLAQQITKSDWEKAKNLIQLARIAQIQKDLSPALDSIQVALELLKIPLQSLGDTNSKSSLTDLIPNPYFIDALTVKAGILYDQYVMENEMSALQSAWETVKTGADGLNNMLLFYDSFRDKENLIAKSYALFEMAITIGHELYQSTKERSYLEESFFFAEQSKAIMIKDAFKQTYAQRIGIPESYRQKNLSYKSRLFSLNKKIINLKNKNKTYDSFLKKYLSLKEQYYTFRQDTLVRFPKYDELVNNKTNLDLSRLWDVMRNNHTILEYFIGEKKSFVFILRPQKKIELVELEVEKEKLRDATKKFLNCIYSYNDVSCHQEWPSQSYHLYQRVFQPIEKKVTQEITIIPDGILCYIPFSTLISKAYVGKGKTPYGSLDYLLNQHIIKYNYSVSTSLEEPDMEREVIGKHFLGFAPSFESEKWSFSSGQLGGRDHIQLPPIAGASDLIETIAEAYGESDSWIFQKSKGTKQRFLDHAPNAAVIHLHTHGILNEDHLDESFLAFYRDGEDTLNARLSIGEIYDLQLNAEIITLPACYSAYGANLKGQGIISMARGFFYAGAKSVFSSLWQSNNVSLSEITQLFYAHLNNGLEQEEAMWQAKKDYLENHQNELEAYPFFWGSYIGISKMSKQSSKIRWFPILIISGLILLFGFYFFKKEQKEIVSI